MVDNHSGDGTADRVRALAAPIVRVIQCESHGAARARNRGAMHATGRVFAFVDADTRMPLAACDRIMRLADDGYTAGIFRLGAQHPTLRSVIWWTFWNAVRLLPLARAKAMPAFMFCTRTIFDRFGPFDPDVAIGEEWPILAGLYRNDRRRLIYDRSLTALTSSRRMELQWFGYTRTYIKYATAILWHSARVRYSDTIRER